MTSPEYPSAGHPILVLEDVAVSFGGLRALSKVSFVVQSGQAVAVVGPNGAGKTTLLNAISGLNPVSAHGQITFDGTRVEAMRPAQVAALGIGRSFQSPQLTQETTVIEAVLSGAHLDLPYSAWEQCLRPRRVARLEKAARARAADLLDEVGLGWSARLPVGALPFGHQKMIDILRAVIGRPKLLLLDEPSSGVSEADRHALIDVLARMRANRELSLLLVEHHLDVVREIAETTVALQAGTVLMTGITVGVLESEQFRAALTGRAVLAP